MDTSQQLDYLISLLAGSMLADRMPAGSSLYPNVEIPQKMDDKWRLFRSLVNVREPIPVTDDFLAVQDNVLQAIIAENGITDAETLEPLRDNMYLWRGDITTFKVDAIVNAANSGMLGCFIPCHSCIDNAIHTFAGVQLRLACANIMQKQGYSKLATGQAILTSAFNLPSNYILHTVGPVIRGKVSNEDKQLLADCYTSCLSLAEEHTIESVAFCCISTGEFHFPNEEAANIAVNAVAAFLKNSNRIKKLVFNVFKEQDENIYRRLLG